MKSGKIRKYLKTRVRLKLFERKLQLKFILKLKSQKLNLKIGIFFKNLKMVVLKIKLKQNGILDIKFERN